MELAKHKKHKGIMKYLQSFVGESIHQILMNKDTVSLERVLSTGTEDIEKIDVSASTITSMFVLTVDLSQHGKMPLLLAVEQGYYEGVELLLRHKANIFVTQSKVNSFVLLQNSISSIACRHCIQCFMWRC